VDGVYYQKIRFAEEKGMNKEKITLLAVGDVIIGRDEPTTILKHVVDVLRSGDISFATCDQAYSNKGDPYISPTHVLRPDPNNISALVYAGLSLVSLANNHSMDLGPENLLDSIDMIRKAGIEVVGVGKNILEARQPAILERKNNRIGFLAYGCVGPDRAVATEDKPGHAPIRAWTIYKQVDLQPGTPPEIITLAYRDELTAMEEDIRILKSQVDVVVVSFHWGLHFLPALIPMYEFEIGHAAIDAGADIIFGCHAHILKGIEVYKGKVIFHGLGNFAAEHKGKLFERMGGGPYVFVPQAKATMAEARSTIMAKVIIEGGEIKKVSYIPCYINENSEPEIVTYGNSKGEEVFSYMEYISRRQNLNTNLDWEGDEVVIST
jgi:poly-gamma-glutamate capsule biosynthesis protein CapA/YwtB (metallophosphatase superfamily)